MPAKRIAPDLMYRLLVQGVKDYAIYLLDETGTVLNWNAGAERAKGYTAEEIVGQNYDLFYSAEDRARGLPKRNLDLALKGGHLSTEGWRYRKDGTAFWAQVALDAIYDEDGDFVGFAKVTRDLTEQRETARRFEHQATHDALTGVSNRAGLADCLESQFPQIVYGSKIAVHYVDLDRFKPVNDTFGHHVGDEVLCEVARRLEAAAGPSGVVGRLGGDEFAVLQFGSPSPEEISALADAIVDSIAQPFIVGSKTANIGASVGVAVAPDDATTVPTIMRNADLALYAAKSAGRNCACFFEPTMDEEALSRSLLELKLRHAVEAQDFELHYQPIVDARAERTIGFEALLRWTDQTGHSISPAVFVPVAEELGLMVKLGEWVLRTACAEAATWPGDLVVAVNLSAKQLKDPELANLVMTTLKKSGLPPQRLELEITETAILHDLASARRTLEHLRELGVLVALDDFGTGFSSLSLVRELPLTRIKIDRSFVSEIDQQPQSTAVVRSVLALCQGYGLDTTAEGVETECQRDQLLLNGCRELQGYLFGRPSPASQIHGDWIKADRTVG